MLDKVKPGTGHDTLGLKGHHALMLDWRWYVNKRRPHDACLGYMPGKHYSVDRKHCNGNYVHCEVRWGGKNSGYVARLKASCSHELACYPFNDDFILVSRVKAQKAAENMLMEWIYGHFEKYEHAALTQELKASDES